MGKTNKDNFETKTNERVKKRPVAHFHISLGENQNNFIYELLNKTKLRIGQIVWQSVMYAENSDKTDIPLSFLTEYITFVYDKTHGLNMGIQKVATSHESLKKASEMYKSIGYNIGIKGVVLLYLLYYAKNHLKMDINKYKSIH